MLEAIGHGIPVVTNAAGVEGIVLEPESGAVVGDAASFGAGLVALLNDPERRAALGRRGRADVIRHHAPRAAAAHWATACERVAPAAPR